MTMKSTRTLSREQSKVATRVSILDAALRSFAQKGIQASTVSEVAHQAGKAHGSIFVHFGTQEGLIVSAIEDFGRRVSLRLHELADAGAGTREVLEAHLRGIKEWEDFYTRLVVEAPNLPSQARLSLTLIQSAIAFHLSPALEADRRAGKIKNLPLPFLFNTWIGLLHHYLANRELFSPVGSLIKNRGPELLDQFMELVSREKGDPS